MPTPPYYAVIFTSTLSEKQEGYQEMAIKMEELAKKQKGFLGIEAAREELGITVSYWADLEAIKSWKRNAEHISAQQKGYDSWYSTFKVRIAKVEHDYGI